MVFFKRLQVIPFETYIGFLCVWNGFAAIMHWGIFNDPFRSILGEFLANVFNAGYIAAGILLIYGMGCNRRHVEVLGLSLIAMSLVIRAVAAVFIVGFSPVLINGYVTVVATIVACGVRFYTLFSNRVLVETKDLKLKNADTTSTIAGL